MTEGVDAVIDRTPQTRLSPLPGEAKTSQYFSSTRWPVLID